MNSLEQAMLEVRRAEAILREAMGDSIEDCDLAESVALLVSQRENARNAHAATKGENDALLKSLKDLMLVGEHMDLSQGMRLDALFPVRFKAARDLIQKEAK